MPRPFETALDELRAVAEPSRLRLLAILAKGEFSVTELTQVLSQSQPRVSRHLKLLCDAGLLEKFREQHWVYYRVPAAGAGREFVEEVVARVDPADRTLVTDDMRVKAVLAQRSATGDVANDPATRGDSTELAAALAEELGDRGRGSLFYFGRSPAEVLVGLASRARRVVGMHRSRPAVQRARAVLHSRGLSHCLLQQGELHNLPHLAGEFDTVVLDRALSAEAGPVEALREAARVLRADGELLVVAEYDALAQLESSTNPLHTLRAWTADAGLACTRLRPVDLDGQHLLLGVVRVAGALTRTNEAAAA